MPYGIRHDKKKHKWDVINKETGHVFGHHPTEDAAQGQLGAIEANTGGKTLSGKTMTNKNTYTRGQLQLVARNRKNLSKGLAIRGTDSNPQFSPDKKEPAAVHIGTQPTDVAHVIQQNGWQGDLDNLWKILQELDASSTSLETVLEEMDYTANRALGAIQQSQGIELSDQATMNMVSNLRQNIALYKQFIKQVNIAMPSEGQTTTEYQEY